MKGGAGFGGGRGGKKAASQTCVAPAGQKQSASQVAAAAAAEEKRLTSANLWIVKLLFFLFYGSLGSVMPYLPVYYHSLGIPGS